MKKKLTAKLTTKYFITTAALLVVGFALFPLHTFAGSLALHEIWRCFLADHYGSGPTVGEWFGITVLITILMPRKPTNSDDDEGLSARDLGLKMIFRTLQSSAYLLAVVGISWLIGVAFGWV